MRRDDKIYSLLGFAAKMRKLAFGKERIRGYLRSNREKKLLVVAIDASERTKRDLEIRSFKKCKIIEMFTKEELGRLVGKDEVSVFAIEDDSIIDGILKHLEGRIWRR